MENGHGDALREEEEEDEEEWKFGPSEDLLFASRISIRGVLGQVMENVVDSHRPPVPLGHGDPSVFPCFRTASDAVDAVVSAVRSADFNCYSPTVGLLSARRAVAKYLSRDLPYELTTDDVYITNGPGYPFYEARAAFSRLEARHFDLLPNEGWEIDLDAVEALADANTVAMVLINPGNPCGNVFRKQHLTKVAETARKLGILVIADEVYDHLAFGETPFVPMGVFGSIVPVVTVGSISKRWVVPGWRLGWIVTSDPNGILKKTKENFKIEEGIWRGTVRNEIVEGIKGILNITTDPTTFTQGAVSDIIKNTKEDFFRKTIDLLRETADVELKLSLLNGIENDVDFCCKLAREESVIILPGSAVGLKNWLRITFAVGPSSLEDGLGRLKSFCERHSKAE
ncbi:Nicotianamine aminotransferase B [Acorus calamus]|uniref:Nicotianamine aminotransferase B n=1 Tax=Acorus calamus TaxID=4465 RepID=A0AAV9DK45_ACOCL|nr:Nicotianamine aminotransferase B [Acorus calamus]